jgi:mono/diheme cytochrome c family protein
VLFDVTKHGVAKAADLKDYDSAMPAFGAVLSDAEIVAVLAWIRSQWPAEIRRQQEEVNAQALRNAARR